MNKECKICHGSGLIEEKEEIAEIKSFGRQRSHNILIVTYGKCKYCNGRGNRDFIDEITKPYNKEDE